MSILWIILGLLLLVAGAEALVRGASKSAAALGISPLVIGLTVVAFGTSAPELAVSVMSSYSGQADIALGNVVGSNIFNVLMILGLSAAITPLAVSRQLIRLDVPLMIAASILLYGLGMDGRIGQTEGSFLVAGIVLYTVFLIIKSRRENRLSQLDEFSLEYGAPPAISRYDWIINIAAILAGLGLLVLGSRFLVSGAVAVATHLGVSELIIGLTIVAAGTSLPELATSVVASIRGERDIAVGNVVGSNLFNILSVMGLASVVTVGGIPVSKTALAFDIPVMIGVAVACLPVFFSGRRINRWEGLLFLSYYGFYTIYVMPNATRSDDLGAFTAAMAWFVIPLTVLSLILITWHAIRTAEKKSSFTQ